MDDYQFPKDMIEISGFGGGYEATCRKMVVAGLKWLDEHPNANPKFHSYKHLYGIIDEDNEGAKELSKAVVGASDGDCTGAMHQATITHVMWIRKNGWGAYIKEMTRASRSTKNQTGEVR